MVMPIPTRLFHMTALDNIESIFQNNMLMSKNSCSTENISYGNIAHSSIQNRRSIKEVPMPPHGTLHDYVPFYFAPRSPMLYAINQGNVDNCDYRQKDIIYFQTTIETVKIFEKLYVFTDRNASLEYAMFETDYNKLNIVNWNYLTDSPTLDGYCKYFQDNQNYPDRREIRQAEFLVYECLALNMIENIGVYDDHTLQIVKELLTKYNLEIPVSIKSDWYF